MPTFTKYGSTFTPAYHSRGTSHALLAVNNWLKENPASLGFGRYNYPSSVETPTLDKRNFYGSFPPGLTLQLYVLFKLLDFTGFVPDIYEKRGAQLLLVILYKYLLHLLTSVLLCIGVFFVCRKLNFDHFNSTILATTPAIVQFHSAGTLFWNHFQYNAFTVVLLTFVTYILMEVLRVICVSSKVQLFIRIAQPLIMFWGMFTDWLFAFVALTIYIMRIKRKEIDLPVSFQQAVRWAKQSGLFFLPPLLAVVLWLCQIAYNSQYIASQYSFLDTPISSRGFTALTNLLYKMGLLPADGEVTSIWQYLYYHKQSLFTSVNTSYGIIGLLMLYFVGFLATRSGGFTNNRINIAASAYLMYFVPCLVYHLFFVQSTANHLYSPLAFSSSLSISFAFAPIFILQMLKKNHLTPAIYFLNKKSITVVALAGFVSSVLYGYTQVYNKLPATKMFTPPDYIIKNVGNFVWDNTGYYDVVFSQDYYFNDDDHLTFDIVYFSGKLIYFSSNLDHVYHKTKKIEQNFTVRVLYLEPRREEIEQLAIFLRAQSIPVDNIQEGIGGMLVFGGIKFVAWYEQVHECDLYPQRCKEDLTL